MTLAVFAMVLLTLTGMALLDLGFKSRIKAIRTAQGIRAQWAADAGVYKALAEMNKKLKAKTWSDTSMPTVTDEALFQSDQSFSYQVGRNADGTYMVTSVGTAGPIGKQVSAIFGLKGLFESAILVKDRISLMPNTQVRGYNSKDPTDSEFDLAIGTTSTLAGRIPLGPGTVVDGDVFVGVGGDPKTVIGAGGTITGQKYSLNLEPHFPDVIPPSLPAVGTPLSTKGETIMLNPSNSGTYSEINLSQARGQPGVLEIQGGEVILHITGNINLGNGCELIVRPGSSLVLYVDGDIASDNSVGINNEAGNVKDLQLYATGTGGQVFSLKAKSSVFGTVYAPEADITLYPNSEMRGAIVGRNVTFKSGAFFHYDEALKEAQVGDEGVSFVVKRWYDGNP
ncbi:MAG: hypothetical protein JSW66_00600 [Phycisphaerales bacterium]|nr:MAG: hypothetical protein JSW66_00600 [Phycisphaerales bacterium]